MKTRSGRNVGGKGGGAGMGRLALLTDGFTRKKELPRKVKDYMSFWRGKKSYME